MTINLLSVLVLKFYTCVKSFLRYWNSYFPWHLTASFLGLYQADCAVSKYSIKKGKGKRPQMENAAAFSGVCVCVLGGGGGGEGHHRKWWTAYKASISLFLAVWDLRWVGRHSIWEDKASYAIMEEADHFNKTFWTASLCQHSPACQNPW